MPRSNGYDDTDQSEEGKEFNTPQFDPRFPNQNQTYNCFVNYVDFHRCQDLLRDTPEKCDVFKRVFEAMCPNAWVEKWDSMRESGTFPHPIIRVPHPDESQAEEVEAQKESANVGSVC